MQHVIKNSKNIQTGGGKQHFGFFHQRNICKFAGQAISIYRNHTLIWGPETVGRTT